MHQKAFTLIELLVVVLIIGILAAVALPQYTKTVERSRAAEAMLNLETIKKSLVRAKMEGRTGSFEDVLDVELSGGAWETNSTERRYRTPHFLYLAYGCSTIPGCDNLTAIRLNGGIGLYVLETLYMYTPEQITLCWTNETAAGRGVCKQLENQGYEYAESVW